ncbi:MAG: nuclear transport factor 2 family protein [Anaerolineales bacterium]|nr:nuclear transport factor 2 family protein [Anaerolineales bacterium]
MDTLNIPDTIIALERTALDHWENGDPGGFLETTAPEAAYFDPYLEQRLDGIEALRTLYEPIWGKIYVDRYEWVNPRVQVCGENVAVSTFNHIVYSSDEITRWNCTEVYRQDDGHWRIIQTHWSYTGHGK